MSVEALTPTSAPPFAGLVPWLASLWRRLRAHTAQPHTASEVQLLHLIEFAASRFGDPLLDATSLDDLDDRLDSLVSSNAVAHLAALLGEHVLEFASSEPTSSAVLVDVVAETLGIGQGRIVANSQQILDAWLSAQRQLLSELVHDHAVVPQVPELQLDNPDIPAEVGILIFHGQRASFCSLAIVRALISEEAIPPWLASAITERLVSSAREHLRLLASLPGVVVDEAVVPRSHRLQLESIVDRHARARSRSIAEFQQAKVRLGL